MYIALILFLILYRVPGRRGKDKQAKRALFMSPDGKEEIKLDFLKRSPSRLKSLEMRRCLWTRRKLSKKTTPNKQTPKKHIQTPSKQIPRKGLTPKKHLTSGKLNSKKYDIPRKYSNINKCSPENQNEKNTININKTSNTDEAIQRIHEINENGKQNKLHGELNYDPLTNQQNSTKFLDNDNFKTENEILELSDTQRRVRLNVQLIQFLI